MSSPRDSGDRRGPEELSRALELVQGLRSEVAAMLEMIRRQPEQAQPADDRLLLRQRGLGALIEDAQVGKEGGAQDRRHARARALGQLGGDVEAPPDPPA